MKSSLNTKHLVTCSNEKDQDNVLGNLNSGEMQALSVRSVLVLSVDRVAVGFDKGPIRIFDLDEENAA